MYNYLKALEEAFIVYKIPRYDIKGKEILKTFEKYYVGDQSLLYAVMGYKDRLISGVLENIVMLELKRGGYHYWFLPCSFITQINKKNLFPDFDIRTHKSNMGIYINQLSGISFFTSSTLHWFTN